MIRYIIHGGTDLPPSQVMKAYGLNFAECLFISVYDMDKPKGYRLDDYINLYPLYDKKPGNYEKKLEEETRKFNEKYLD